MVLKDTIAGYARWALAEMRSRAGAPGAKSVGSDRRLLLFASNLPPAVSGVYRPLAWMKYGGERGWRISAVTPELEGEPTAAGRYLLGSVPDDVQIVRSRRCESRPSWRWFPRIDGGFGNAMEMLDAARISCVSAPSVVIASGPSFCSFVSALFAARYWRRPLVLDYRDEWTECPFDFIATGNMDRYWEKRCFDAAARIIFTTASQLEHQVRVFGPQSRSKCALIPNGWEPSDWSEPESRPAPMEPGSPGDSARVRISHVGTLGNHADPTKFLSALTGVLARDASLRQRIEITFVGYCAPKPREAIAKFEGSIDVHVKGLVPKPEANLALREAGIILLITNEAMRRYVPGKLYEYVASGRPVLVYGHEGEASRIVEELDAGVLVKEGDEQGLSRAIDELSARGREPRRSAKQQQWLDRHTRRALTDQLFDLIEGLPGLSLPARAQ